MKHTNYQAKISEVKALEYEELKRAVEAHGGSYDWTINEGCSPVIAINPECSEPGPVDIDVTKVVLRNGSLEIFGVDNINREPIDFDIDDIFAGHLSIITDYIPETDTISDVSLSVPDIPEPMARATQNV